MYRTIDKICIEKLNGEKIILILPKPISFARYYALKFELKATGDYKKVTSLWKDSI